MQHAPIYLVSALRETSIFFVIIIAIFVLNERTNFVRILSAILILNGAITLRLVSLMLWVAHYNKSTITQAFVWIAGAYPSFACFHHQ